MEFLMKSYAARILKIVYAKCYRSQCRFFDAYRNSAVNKIIELFRKKAAIAFQYSLLGRLTDTANAAHGQSAVINSKVLTRLLNLYYDCMARISAYSDKSEIFNSATELKSELRLHPVKAGGVIIFTAVLVNITLSLLSRKETGTWAWAEKAAILLAAFCAMFYNARFKELKNTSRVLKLTEKENR